MNDKIYMMTTPDNYISKILYKGKTYDVDQKNIEQSIQKISKEVPNLYNLVKNIGEEIYKPKSERQLINLSPKKFEAMIQKQTQNEFGKTPIKGIGYVFKKHKKKLIAVGLSVAILASAFGINQNIKKSENANQPDSDTYATDQLEETDEYNIAIEKIEGFQSWLNNLNIIDENGNHLVISAEETHALYICFNAQENDMIMKKLTANLGYSNIDYTKYLNSAMVKIGYASIESEEVTKELSKLFKNNEDAIKFEEMGKAYNTYLNNPNEKTEAPFKESLNDILLNPSKNVHIGLEAAVKTFLDTANANPAYDLYEEEQFKIREDATNQAVCNINNMVDEYFLVINEGMTEEYKRLNKANGYNEYKDDEYQPNGFKQTEINTFGSSNVTNNYSTSGTGSKTKITSEEAEKNFTPGQIDTAEKQADETFEEEYGQINQDELDKKEELESQDQQYVEDTSNVLNNLGNGSTTEDLTPEDQALLEEALQKALQDAQDLENSQTPVVKTMGGN